MKRKGGGGSTFWRKKQTTVTGSVQLIRSTDVCAFILNLVTKSSCRYAFHLAKDEVVFAMLVLLRVVAFIRWREAFILSQTSWTKPDPPTPFKKIRNEKKKWKMMTTYVGEVYPVYCLNLNATINDQKWTFSIIYFNILCWWNRSRVIETLKEKKKGRWTHHVFRFC